MARKSNSPNGRSGVRKLLNLMNTISFGVAEKTKKNTFFEKQTGEVLYFQQKTTSIAKNKPENEAGKLLKTRTCGKNKAKNKPGHVIENK